MSHPFDLRSASTAVFIVLFSSLVTTPLFSQDHAGKQTNETLLVRDNSAFSIALYQEHRGSEGNLFFSPYSISAALAMTYAGARGNTAEEMAQTLRFSLGQAFLHTAFADLRMRLDKLQEEDNIELHVANSLWPQQDYKIRKEYLALIEESYCASITPLDFKNSADLARTTINAWVQDRTQGKIPDIIPPGVLNALTRLVLVNAIYFKGDWETPFETKQTKERSFYLSRSNSVQVPTMTHTQKFWYADFETLQVMELPYTGDELSMLLLLPHNIDGLAGLERSLTAEGLQQWRQLLRRREVRVFLPKFSMATKLDLKITLASMGMVDAFDISHADFSGMDGETGGLYIETALHRAYVDVNEKGTEAAAATSIGFGEGVSADFLVFRANHPFIFLIQDDATGSILFLGRVNDPTVTGA